MKKLPLIIFAVFCSLVPALQAESIIVKGTYAGDTSYNVKKLFNGRDDELCWAAAASNVIQLWQDRLEAGGVTIPSTTPNGQKSQAAYSSDIFATFVDNWTNGGGYNDNAFSWWLFGTIIRTDGFDDPEAQGEYALPIDGSLAGAYWTGIGMDDVLVAQSFDFWNMSSRNFLKELFDTSFASDILFSMGIAEIDEEDGEQANGHAVSLWGYEFENGEITGLWISDSDNEIISNFLVDIFWDDEVDKWAFGESSVEGDVDYTTYYLSEITTFIASAQIPEPAGVIFLVSAAALVIAGVFRRRRK